MVDFCFFCVSLAANPIFPAFISEVYFEDEDWMIELYDYHNASEPIYECIWIASSADTVYFNSGVQFSTEETFVIIEADLQEPLPIDKNGDFIIINIEGDEYEYVDEVYFGDISYSHVNPPYENQSLSRIVYYDQMGSGIFYLAKDNEPTIGYDPFTIQTKGTLAGYVYDANGEGVSNAVIKYTPSNFMAEFYTDENGYFENNEMYGMNYNVKVFVDDNQLDSIDLTVEPDSTTFYEFHTDLSSAEPIDFPITKISNYPNPYYLSESEHHTIAFSLANVELADANIVIYNSKGQKVANLNTQTASGKTEFNVHWDGRDTNGKLVNSGVYFYTLVIDGEKVASDKIIVLK